MEGGALLLLPASWFVGCFLGAMFQWAASWPVAAISFLGFWRIGRCRRASVVARDDSACRFAGIGARLDEWRRRAVVTLANWERIRVWWQEYL